MEKIEFATELKGERIVLRKYPNSLEHAKEAFAVMQDNIKKAPKYISVPHDISSPEEYFETIVKRGVSVFESGDEMRYTIFLKEKFIGYIWAVKIDYKNKACRIGYVLDYNHSGHGYMTEACKTLEDYIFDVGFERIESGHAKNNLNSKGVLIRRNFTMEGTQRQLYNSDEHKDDFVMYSKLKSEWVK
jgi:RimJ/RimL family protein N-acetyltransferase